ncbi:MAG: TetR family transcriptional regulator [Bryobacterales bacterium]|nr:TetR family transcriptional regulator [Bryobacterales bacterium]
MDRRPSAPSSLRDRRRAETTREITAAALSLFAEKGFEAATASEIAQRAGVSRATFFNYFPRKELILASFARSRVERIQSLLASRGAFTLDSLLDLFIEFAAENERFGSGPRSLLPLILFHPACQAAVQPILHQARQALAEGLGRDGALKSGVNARVFAESFFGLYISTVLQWSVHPNPPKGWHVRTVRQRLGLLVRLAKKGADT